MRSVLKHHTEKDSDFDHLKAVIEVYSEKKVLEWLDCKMVEEQMTDYEWVIHCIRWETAIHGGIRYDNEGTEGKIIK